MTDSARHTIQQALLLALAHSDIGVREYDEAMTTVAAS